MATKELANGTVFSEAKGGPGDSEFDDEQAKWAARLVTAGSALTLLFQFAYIVLDRQFLSLRHPSVLILHLLNISLYGIAVIASVFLYEWSLRHWKMIAFLFSSLMIWSSSCIAMLTHHSEPLLFMVVLFLAGTGTFLSWGAGAQAWLTLVAITAFTFVNALVAVQNDAYYWLAVVIAGALGLCSAALLKGLRRARRKIEMELLRSREILAGQEGMRLAGQLAAGIAHDLNNHLNVVKLRLSALQLDDEISIQQSAQLAVIDRAIEDAARTVARVRDLGKTRSSSAAEPVDLGEVIDQAIELARTTIQGRPGLGTAQIQIIANVRNSLPCVGGNASELRQVFLNLLLNASEAIGGEGTISIDAVEENEVVLITVSDSGSGIPKEHLPHIFEPFYTTKGAHGTGLGLSIVRGIVQGLGGTISAATRAQGGAAITFSLPISEKPLAPAATSVPRMSDACRFLLVDDDPENSYALAEVLKMLGHSADIAVSGTQALQKLRAHQPYDIVLCDLGMPGMNGWEVASRALQLIPNLAFYIVTGWGRQLEQATPVRISGVLAKPVDPIQLQRVVAEFLARAGSLRSPNRLLESA